MRRKGNIYIDAIRGGHGSGGACGSHQHGDGFYFPQPHFITCTHDWAK